MHSAGLIRVAADGGAHIARSGDEPAGVAGLVKDFQIVTAGQMNAVTEGQGRVVTEDQETAPSIRTRLSMAVFSVTAYQPPGRTSSFPLTCG